MTDAVTDANAVTDADAGAAGAPLRVPVVCTGARHTIHWGLPDPAAPARPPVEAR